MRSLPHAAAAAVVCAVTGALLAGCGSTEAMDHAMATWKGAPLEEVVDRWGYPDEDKVVAGHRLIVWHRESTRYRPTTEFTTGYVRGAPVPVTVRYWERVRSSCSRMVEIDRAERVIGWQWKGDDCCMSLSSGWCANLARPGVKLPARQ